MSDSKERGKTEGLFLDEPRWAQETQRWASALSLGREEFVAFFLREGRGQTQNATDQRECWLARKGAALNLALAGELARFESIQNGRFAMHWFNVVGDEDEGWAVERLGLAAGVGAFVTVWEERVEQRPSQLPLLREALASLARQGFAQGPVELGFREDRRDYPADVFRACRALKERAEMGSALDLAGAASHGGRTPRL